MTYLLKTAERKYPTVKIVFFPIWNRSSPSLSCIYALFIALKLSYKKLRVG
ncbi:MAG: hypothetical protein H6Q17_828 [Bacteroidetes bacterium]|nr:hypothetical protein [Bacteroidota bacterium]